MKFCPYKSFSGVDFNSTKDEVFHVFGSPKSESLNSLGWEELDYGDAVFRLDEQGKFVEVTANLEYVGLDGNKVRYIHLKEYLTNNDKEVIDVLGFVVSPKYGLAFDPEHKFWVTHFRQSELKEWRNEAS